MANLKPFVLPVPPSTTLLEQLEIGSLLSIVVNIKDSPNKDTQKLESLVANQIYTTLTTRMPLVKEEDPQGPNTLSIEGIGSKPN